MLELRCRQVSNKDLATLRGFASDILRKITDGNVNWIRSLVPEQGDLCLVGRDDDGNDSCARFVGFDSVLL